MLVFIVESAIKYEKRTQAAGWFPQKPLDITPALWYYVNVSDELKGESGSIGTQRDILTQHCKEQNLRIAGEYAEMEKIA